MKNRRVQRQQRLRWHRAGISCTRHLLANWGAYALMVLTVVLVPLIGYTQSGQSDDALFIDTSGRVGIGTQAPEAELDVAGQTKLDGSVGIGAAPDAGQQLLVQPAKKQAPLKVTDPTGQKNWFTVSSQGDVGIGTDNPGAQLEVAGDAKVGAQLNVAGAVTIDDKLEVKGGTQVGGDARVNGNFSYQARYQRDDEPEKHYEISPRYHLSLTAKIYEGRTKTIPQEILEELCADYDGCQVRLAMTGWGPGVETRHASVFFTYYYSTETGLWRASATDASNAEGKDNDGVTQHVRNIWNTCFFTDGTYGQYQNQGDKTKGLQLLVWNGYKHPNRTCECTLID